MVEIVNDPGGQVLAERHATQFRMPSPTFEIGGGKPRLAETRQAVRSSSRELVKELLERATTRPVELRKPVERCKGHRLAVREDVFDARNPIRLLPLDEVSDNVERVPGAGTFGLDDPGFRQFDQQFTEDHWSPAQERERRVEVERHVP